MADIQSRVARMSTNERAMLADVALKIAHKRKKHNRRGQFTPYEHDPVKFGVDMLGEEYT